MKSMPVRPTFLLRFEAPALLLATWVSLASAADWPQYRGPNANGVTSEKIQKTWPGDGPRQLWKTPLNTGFSTFAVAGGKTFTLVSRDIDGVKNEVCLALNADSGKELWAAPLGFAKYDGGGDSGADGNKDDRQCAR